MNKNNNKQKHNAHSDKVQHTHIHDYKNNHDPYINYQHTNTSLQTQFHTKRQYTLKTQKDNKTSHAENTKHDKTKQNKTKIQIITIPTLHRNIQIDYFKTSWYILNTLTTYKYIHFKKKLDS